jgi:hypothetical protein
MWKRHHIEDQTLDRLSDELLRALEPSEAEITTAANSPFLFRRIRARIEAEERARAEERSPWRALLVQARHALPVVAVLAMMALGALWYAPTGALPANGAAEDQSSLLTTATPPLEEELVFSLVGWEAGEANSRKEKQ